MANNYNSYKSRYTGNQVDSAVGKAQKALTEDDIVQTTGQYANKVMSQAAVSTLMANAATNQNIANAIENHNVSSTSHQDIRNAVNQKPDALNYRTDSLFNTYTTKFINDNFASITFVNNLYAQKKGANTAEFINTLPAISNANILKSEYTTNTDYNWDSPDFVFTRELQVNTTLTMQNSFELNLKFKVNRNATLSFGVKIKVSTDNGSTWNYISSNQTTSSQVWEQDVGNTIDLLCYTDLIQNPITYNSGTLLAIEVFKKQQSNQHLTTSVYCGVFEDGANIYTYVRFNFTNVNLGTGQLEDNSVTYQKLSVALQEIVNKVPQITHKTETSIIYPQNWGTLSGNQLFNYYATINLISQVSDNTMIELVNDNPVDFALYGFSLMEYNPTSNTVTIYAISAPSTSINFTLEIYETEPILLTLYAPTLYYLSQEYNPTIIQIDNNTDNPSTVNYYLYYNGDNFTNQIGQADPSSPTIDLRNISELREAGEYTLKARVVSLTNPGSMSDFSDSLTYISSGSQEETGLDVALKYDYDSVNNQVNIDGTLYTMTYVERVVNGNNIYPLTYNSSTGMYEFTISPTTYNYDGNGMYLRDLSDNIYPVISDVVTINNQQYTYDSTNNTFTDGVKTYTPYYDGYGAYYIFDDQTNIKYYRGYGYVTDNTNYYPTEYTENGEIFNIGANQYTIEIGDALTDGTSDYMLNYGRVEIGVNTYYTEYNDLGDILYFRTDYTRTSWSDLVTNGYVSVDENTGVLTIHNEYFNSGNTYTMYIPSTVTTITANNFSGCLVQFLYFNADISFQDVGANAFDNSSIIEVYSDYSNSPKKIYPITIVNLEFIVTNEDFDFSTLDISLYPQSPDATIISSTTTATGMIFTVTSGAYYYNAMATGYNSIYYSLYINRNDTTINLTFVPEV